MAKYTDISKESIIHQSRYAELITVDASEITPIRTICSGLLDDISCDDGLSPALSLKRLGFDGFATAKQETPSPRTINSQNFLPTVDYNISQRASSNSIASKLSISNPFTEILTKQVLECNVDANTTIDYNWADGENSLLSWTGNKTSITGNAVRFTSTADISPAYRNNNSRTLKDFESSSKNLSYLKKTYRTNGGKVSIGVDISNPKVATVASEIQAIWVSNLTTTRQLLNTDSVDFNKFDNYSIRFSVDNGVTWSNWSTKTFTIITSGIKQEIQNQINSILGSNVAIVDFFLNKPGEPDESSEAAIIIKFNDNNPKILVRAEMRIFSGENLSGPIEAQNIYDLPVVTSERLRDGGGDNLNELQIVNVWTENTEYEASYKLSFNDLESSRRLSIFSDNNQILQALNEIDIADAAVRRSRFMSKGLYIVEFKGNLSKINQPLLSVTSKRFLGSPDSAFINDRLVDSVISIAEGGETTGSVSRSFSGVYIDAFMNGQSIIDGIPIVVSTTSNREFTVSFDVGVGDFDIIIVGRLDTRQNQTITDLSKIKVCSSNPLLTDVAGLPINCSNIGLESTLYYNWTQNDNLDSFIYNRAILTDDGVVIDSFGVIPQNVIDAPTSTNIDDLSDDLGLLRTDLTINANGKLIVDIQGISIEDVYYTIIDKRTGNAVTNDGLISVNDDYTYDIETGPYEIIIICGANEEDILASAIISSLTVCFGGDVIETEFDYLTCNTALLSDVKFLDPESTEGWNILNGRVDENISSITNINPNNPISFNKTFTGLSPGSILLLKGLFGDGSYSATYNLILQSSTDLVAKEEFVVNPRGKTFEAEITVPGDGVVSVEIVMFGSSENIAIDQLLVCTTSTETNCNVTDISIDMKWNTEPDVPVNVFSQFIRYKVRSLENPADVVYVYESPRSSLQGALKDRWIQNGDGTVISLNPLAPILVICDENGNNCLNSSNFNAYVNNQFDINSPNLYNDVITLPENKNWVWSIPNDANTLNFGTIKTYYDDPSLWNANSSGDLEDNRVALQYSSLASETLNCVQSGLNISETNCAIEEISVFSLLNVIKPDTTPIDQLTDINVEVISGGGYAGNMVHRFEILGPGPYIIEFPAFDEIGRPISNEKVFISLDIRFENFKQAIEDAFGSANVKCTKVFEPEYESVLAGQWGATAMYLVEFTGIFDGRLIELGEPQSDKLITVYEVKAVRSNDYDTTQFYPRVKYNGGNRTIYNNLRFLIRFDHNNGTLKFRIDDVSFEVNHDISDSDLEDIIVSKLSQFNRITSDLSDVRVTVNDYSKDELLGYSYQRVLKISITSEWEYGSEVGITNIDSSLLSGGTYATIDIIFDYFWMNAKQVIRYSGVSGQYQLQIEDLSSDPPKPLNTTTLLTFNDETFGEDHANEVIQALSDVNAIVSDYKVFPTTNELYLEISTRTVAFSSNEIFTDDFEFTIQRPLVSEENDLLLAFISTYDGEITEVPEGWALLKSAQALIIKNISGTDFIVGITRSYWYYKIHDGNEPNSYTWSSSTPIDYVTALMVSYSDVDPENPIDQIDTVTFSSKGLNNFDIDAINTTENDKRVVLFGSVNGPRFFSETPPTDFNLVTYITSSIICDPIIYDYYKEDAGILNVNVELDGDVEPDIYVTAIFGYIVLNQSVDSPIISSVEFDLFQRAVGNFSLEYIKPINGLLSVIESNDIINKDRDIDLTLNYRRGNLLKTFNQTIKANDLITENADISGWDIGTINSGIPGNRAKLYRYDFLIDNPDGGGLDQCSQPIAYVTGGEGSLILNKPQMSAEESFFLEPCTPTIIVNTFQDGNSIDEIQSLVLPSPQSGHYNLIVTINGNSQITEDIPFNASANQLQVKIGRLSNVGGTKNVRVSGSGTNLDPFIIQFTFLLSSKDIDLIDAISTNLFGTSDAFVQIKVDGTRNERQILKRLSQTTQPFRLLYDGDRTEFLAFDSSINRIKSELESILGAGNIIVSGETTDLDQPYSGDLIFDFVNDLSAQNVAPILVESPDPNAYGTGVEWSGGVGVDSIHEVFLNATSGSYNLTVYNPFEEDSFAITRSIQLDEPLADVKIAIVEAASWISGEDIILTRISPQRFTIKFVRGLGKIPIKRTKIDSSNLIGGEIEVTSIQDGIGTREKQRISLIDVTGGFFRLKLIDYKGYDVLLTSDISYLATSENIKSTLLDLPVFNEGDLNVSGAYPSWSVVFRSGLGNIPEFIAEAEDLICDPTTIPPVFGGPYQYELDRPGPGDILPDPDPLLPIRDSANRSTIINLERDLFDPFQKVNGIVRSVRQMASIKNKTSSNYNAYIRSCDNSKLEPINFDELIENQKSYVLISKDIDNPNSRTRLLNRLNSTYGILPSRICLD